MPDPGVQAYVSGKKLEGPRNNPPMWHADPDCSNLDMVEDVREITVAEAEDKCDRQARCCSTIVALEDLD